MTLLPTAHIEAGRLSGSLNWLATIGPTDLSAGTVLKEILLGTLLAGHIGTTVLSGNWAARLHLLPLTQSINAPLWTLHLEFYGSVLVLVLVAIRARWGAKAHAAACLVALIHSGVNPMSLFVIGHLAAPLPFSTRWHALAGRRVTRIAAVAAIAFGMATSSHTMTGIPEFLQWLRRNLHLSRIDDFHSYGLTGAFFIFFGIMAIPPIWAALSIKPLRWLGRISFSIYLIHFPVLFTISSFIYVTTSDRTYSAAVASIAGIALSTVIAMAFERWIDRPAIRLSRRVGGADAKGVNETPISPRHAA